jgi:hypothetical protein
MNEHHIFVPYTDNKPATVEINGHKLVILAWEKDQLEECLDLVGGESVHSVDDESFYSTDELVKGISLATSARVILPPQEMELSDFVLSLKQNLPWYN